MEVLNQKEHTDEETVLRGTVKRVTYRNADNGFVVLQVAVPDEREQLTVVGTAVRASVGTNIVARGSYATHEKFGKQFQARTITETTPTSPEGLKRYLASGIIKGIGPKTAERLIEAFGEETLEMIHRHPEKIARIPGIGRNKAEKISEAFKEKEGMQEVIQFLVEHNISPSLSSRIYERYKNKAVEVLSRDPYLLARDMRGIGFATADTIAMNLGLEADSPQRLKAGIYYALDKARDDGHCYLKRDVLLQQSIHLLGLGESYDLDPYIEALNREGFITVEQDAVYISRLFAAENFVAQFVARRCDVLETPIVDSEIVKTALSNAAQELDLTFSFEQEQAVHAATQHRFMIITGGPGCGKTTIIRALTSVFTRAEKQLVLAAPTGRAAQRMSQVCAHDASTIHRLLKFDPMTRKFMHGQGNPIKTEEGEVDVVVIDEASMIDLMLARDLFSAIPKHAVVILVGDKDQLPSVGPGRVFGDLIAIQDVKTISLSRLFRRSSASTINDIAHMINSGIPPEIPEPDGETKADGYFLPRRDPEEALKLIESLVADQLPRKFGIPLQDICVLTPSNRGPLGTIALNKRLQQKINPGHDRAGISLGDTVFRKGDRVCQRVNNYNIHAAGVFNGDVGEVVHLNKKEGSLQVEMWDGRLVEYESRDISQLSLAYALTVHRSQGSEFPCVVLALHDSHFTLLERQLLYTAVTRAKKLLVVVGSKKALYLAAKRTKARKRLTLLQERVRESLHS